MREEDREGKGRGWEWEERAALALGEWLRRPAMKSEGQGMVGEEGLGLKKWSSGRV